MAEVGGITAFEARFRGIPLAALGNLIADLNGRYPTVQGFILITSPYPFTIFVPAQHLGG
jgi:hypothetical protein